MASTAQLETWLSEAEEALQALSLGVREVSVSYNGQSVSFTPTNSGMLRARINELKRLLGQPVSRRSIPVQF